MALNIQDYKLTATICLSLSVLCSGKLAVRTESFAKPKDNHFRLEYRFPWGTTRVYSFVSVLKQSMSEATGENLTYHMRLAGEIRETAAEMDEKTGTLLIGSLGKAEWEIRVGAEDEKQTAKQQTWLSAYRVDSSGKSVRREPKHPDERRYTLYRQVNQISEDAHICAPFPSRPVTVGSEWEGVVLVPVLGTRQVGHAVSKVIDVGREKGRFFCVIKSMISSDASQSHKTWQPHIWRPETKVKGTSEGRFDIERGVWLKKGWDLTAEYEGRVGGRGFGGVMEIRSTAELVSSTALQHSEAAQQSKKIKDFDRALDALYAGEFEKALKLLKEQGDKEIDKERKRGLNMTIALIEPLLEESAAGKEESRGPEAKLMQEGDLMADREDWEKSVEKYKLLVLRYPHTEFALQALSASASIYEHRLHQPAAAARSRARLVAMREQRAKPATGTETFSSEIYKLASAYAESGEIQKALDSYRTFLRSEHGPLPRRMLAEYRRARLFEQLGRLEDALAAYRAMEAMEIHDTYAGKLKNMAAQKLRELGASQGLTNFPPTNVNFIGSDK
jgi:tetratricopeptide (TPR) repeat protein